MFNPYTAASAAVSYAAAQGAPSAAPANYSGYPTNLYNPAATPAYGLVSYPAATGTAAYGSAVYGTNSASFTGLDAAVYSAATQLLHDRGLAPQSTPASGSSGSKSDALKRLESMNPIPEAATSSRDSRGGSRGGYRGGRGGAGMSYRERHGYPTKPKNPANATVYYCETCKISCAGTDSYNAHLTGSKHKKRDIQVKGIEAAKQAAEEAAKTQAGTPKSKTIPIFPNTSNRSIYCELCNINTAGKAAYDSHLKGKPHQKVLKLHMQLGKHIPENEPTITQRTVESFFPGYAGQTVTPKLSSGSSICAKVVTGGRTVLITPKMNFVGGTILTTTGSGMQEVPSASEPVPPPAISVVVEEKPAEGTSKPETNGSYSRGRGGRYSRGGHRGPPPTPAAAKCSVNPNAISNEPIGESYIQKTERTGKVAYYKCTLCNCEFSDESGMNSHIRGRRHRQEYKKQVDPSIHVEQQNSKKKQMERDAMRAARPRGGPGGMRGAKRPGPGGPPPKRHYGGPPSWSPLGPPRDDPYGPPGYSQPSYGHPSSDHYGDYGPPPIQPPRDYAPQAPGYGVPPYGQPSQGPPAHFQAQVSAGPPSLLGGPPLTSHLPFDQDESYEEVSEENRPRPPPQPPKIDQQYLLKKHRQITPSPRELDSVTNALNTVERALKSMTEKITANNVKLASVTEEVFPTGSERLLKGSYRFGAMTKNLVTKDNLFGEILLIANKHPDAEVLNSVADTLKGELKAMTNQEYAVVAHVDQCGMFVKSLEPVAPGLLSDLQLPVWVYLAYGNLRDELFKQQQAAAEKVAAAVKSSSGEHMLVKFVQSPSATSGDSANAGVSHASSSTAPPSKTALADSSSLNQTTISDAFSKGLDLKRSLNVLAHSRRTRWFQEFISFFPQCRMLMRILNTMCEKQADLRPLVGWPAEFVVITVLRLQATYHGVAPVDIPLAEAFWMILSTMSSGVFLQGCRNGFKDPCERGNIDILGSLSAADRVKLTKACGELVIRWVTGEYAKVLDMEMLKTDPLFVAPPATTTAEVTIKQEIVLETVINGDKAEPMQVDG